MKLLIFLLLNITACFCATDFADRPRNFSSDLLQNTELAKEENAVTSPLGLWTLLSIIAFGSVNDSYTQIATALYFPRTRKMLMEGMRLLMKSVLNPLYSDGVTLTSTNFVFFDNDFRVNKKFIRGVELRFDANVMSLDFQDPHAADIANKEMHKAAPNVNDALQPEDFDQGKMILTNVIYFKGLWSLPFDIADTSEEPFYDESKHVIGSVNMMYQKSPVAYTNVDALKAFALEMPYGSDIKYSMLFILPYPYVKVTDVYKSFATVDIKVILDQLEGDVKEFGLTELHVKIPRFKINTNIVMNNALQNMGVRDIFDARLARFPIISKENVFISTILQMAEIEVTESGTVASAISEAIVTNRMSSPTFYANRPFMYFLVEKSSATVIFNGIYSKPSLY